MWATIEDVELHMGVTRDAHMLTCFAASMEWCQRQRPDLDRFTAQGEAVRKAVVIYAGLLYRERSHPQGFAAYSDLDTGAVDTHSAMMNVYALLGTRRPVVR